MSHADERIPPAYRALWVPVVRHGPLVHHTTTENLASIRRTGWIEPRDPAPKHWAGLIAVFMADTDDPLYEESLVHVLAHVRDKHEALVRLHIETSNPLYRSVDKARTFQVMSLDRIALKEVAKVDAIE